MDKATPILDALVNETLDTHEDESPYSFEFRAWLSSWWRNG